MKVKVACVQQKARIYPDEERFLSKIFQSMDLAREENCGLVVFSEGVGAMLAPLCYTEDLTGVLAEAPALDHQAFLTAEWDFARLEELLSRADLRVYRDLRLDLIKKLYR